MGHSLVFVPLCAAQVTSGLLHGCLVMLFLSTVELLLDLLLGSGVERHIVCLINKYKIDYLELSGMGAFINSRAFQPKNCRAEHYYLDQRIKAVMCLIEPALHN